MERKPRPELPWALWAGIVGALAAGAISVKGIFSSASSTAAIGFIFVPFIAIAAGVLAGVWGLALGTVACHFRGIKQALRPVLIMACVVTAAAPAALGWELWRGWSLQRAVHEVQAMNGAQLDAALASSPWNGNRFFLGAVAQHKEASAALLDRIAALPDPALREGMGSLWDVMGTNRKGQPVLWLVADNPNTAPVTLSRMAADPGSDHILGAVLRNPKTPLAAMAPHFASTNYLLEWGLSLNPNVPHAVLDRLSRSENRYTRMNLTYNRGTPVGILERLANDEDELLARNAARALEKRTKN
jgi:hypothetical protein